MKIFKKVVFLFFLFHFLYTSYLILFEVENLNLLGIYFLLILIIFKAFKSGISKPFSPLFIFSFWFFLSYIIPLPYLINGYSGSASYKIDLFYDPFLLVNVLAIAFFALFGAYLGSNKKKENKISFLINLSNKIRFHSLKSHHLILVFLWFVIAFIIRFNFKLGVAGEQPTILFAGVLQYILLDGSYVIFSYIFIKALEKKGVYLFYAIFLGLLIVISQALLGWRGTIFKLLNLIIVLSWFKVDKNFSLKLPKKYLLAILIAAPIFIQLGNSVRDGGSSALNTESFFNESNFLEDGIMRRQGLTRLAFVSEKANLPFTLTNNFFFLDLIKNDISSTKYIDYNLHGISSEQSHSVGGGGVGNVYLSSGILGVFISYFLLAFFYNKIYFSLVQSRNSIFLLVLYSQMIVVLPYYISENFSTNIFKLMFAIIVLSYVFGKVFYPKKLT